MGIIVIFLGSTFLGYSYGERYKNRSKQLNSINKGLLLLNNEILYGNKPLPIALEEVSFKVDNPLSKIFRAIAIELESGITPNVFTAFNIAYEKYKDEIYLNTEDMEILKDFFKSLGSTGIYGQEKIFALSLENIKNNCVMAENLSKSNVKVCRAIGFTTGAMLALLLI